MCCWFYANTIYLQVVTLVSGSTISNKIKIITRVCQVTCLYIVLSAVWRQ